MVNILDTKNDLTSRIVRAMNVGASREILHDLIVVDEGVSEEDFFLAFKVAEIRFADAEKVATSQ